MKYWHENISDLKGKHFPKLLVLINSLPPFLKRTFSAILIISFSRLRQSSVFQRSAYKHSPTPFGSPVSSHSAKPRHSMQLQGAASPFVSHHSQSPVNVSLSYENLFNSREEFNNVKTFLMKFYKLHF